MGGGMDGMEGMGEAGDVGDGTMMPTTSSSQGPGGGGGGGGPGPGPAPSAMPGVLLPLSDLEVRARNHAILCTIGFLIILPIGVLIARWFWAHWIVQLLIAGPIIGYGWALGYMTTASLSDDIGHFADPHEKVGLALIILYGVQVFVGAIAHFFKLPSIFRGHRPPHSYFHAILGLAIFALAQWQVHYGLFTEWNYATGGVHKVPESAKHAWLALVIVFWVLYGLGLALLRRQYKMESQARAALRAGPSSSSSSMQEARRLNSFTSTREVHR
ncbi:hypothetical protein CVT26_012477 [Gymnopilus dilepis]|uniref:Cytochrome b561 domain-containing protein n=1 Tax=Gymnopilus dilepis TaxID=231916 RepID=A0A409YCV3_9AGAR|nr:hypothetical protein CVT26_012477 [Gymnopilus dilepis]